MNILLFGGSGQLGWELQRALAPLGQVIAPDRVACDLSQADAIRRCIDTVAPRVVINAAAYTAVDRAEHEPEAARCINAFAPGVMAEACAPRGALLVHYSTDYVYDGSGERPWREDDRPAPLNVYGQTKLEGDLAIQQASCAHLILRTSWVFSTRGKNFPRTIIDLAARRPTLDVVVDQVGSPTGADLIADITAHAVRAALRTPRLGGLYHLTAAGYADWCTVARQLLDLALQRGLPLRADARAVRAITSADYKTAARRPLNSRLDTTRLRDAFGIHLPPWQQGIARLIETLA